MPDSVECGLFRFPGSELRLWGAPGPCLSWPHLALPEPGTIRSDPLSHGRVSVHVDIWARLHLLSDVQPAS